MSIIVTLSVIFYFVQSHYLYHNIAYKENHIKKSNQINLE